MNKTEEFIEKAIQIHGDKYDYSKVVYENNLKEVIIICKEHGEFLQKPSSHLQGRGCIKCSNTYNYTTEEWIQKAKSVHNNNYDYSNSVYINAKIPINILCLNCKGYFLQMSSVHLYGGGCSKCCNSKKYSKGQIEWLNFLSSYYNINIYHAENIGEFLIPTTKYRADGYCQDTNTIFEYHGKFWHGSPIHYDSNQINKITNCTFGELYEKTLEKEFKIYGLGYKLITIWDYEWSNVKKSVKILQQKFRNKLK